MHTKIKSMLNIFSLSILLLQNYCVDAMKKTVTENQQIIGRDNFLLLPHELKHIIFTYLDLENLITSTILINSDFYNKAQSFLQQPYAQPMYKELKPYLIKQIQKQDKKLRKKYEKNKVIFDQKTIDDNLDIKVNIEVLDKDKIDRVAYKVLKSNNNVVNYIISTLRKHKDLSKQDLNGKFCDFDEKINKFLQYKGLTGTCNAKTVMTFPELYTWLDPKMIVVEITKFLVENPFKLFIFKDLFEEYGEEINKTINAQSNDIKNNIPVIAYINNSFSESIFNIFKENNILPYLKKLCYATKNHEISDITLFNNYDLQNLEELEFRNANGIPNLSKLLRLKILTLTDNDDIVNEAYLKHLPTKNLDELCIYNTSDENISKLPAMLKEINPKIKLSIISSQAKTPRLSKNAKNTIENIMASL